MVNGGHWGQTFANCFAKIRRMLLLTPNSHMTGLKWEGVCLGVEVKGIKQKYNSFGQLRAYQNDTIVDDPHIM